MNYSYVFISIIVISLSCCRSSSSSDNKVITIRNLQIYSDEFYYPYETKHELMFEDFHFIEKKDTLNFFIERTFYELDINGMAHLHVRYDDGNLGYIPDKKQYRDSTVVSIPQKNDYTLRNIDFNKQLSILDSIIYYSVVRDSYVLPCINFQMDGTGDANVEISKEYLKRGKKADLNEILRESTMTAKIDSLVRKYGLRVENPFVSDGIYYMIPRDEFLKNSLVTTDDIPDELLFFYAVFPVEPIEENKHTCSK